MAAGDVRETSLNSYRTSKWCGGREGGRGGREGGREGGRMREVGREDGREGGRMREVGREDGREGERREGWMGGRVMGGREDVGGSEVGR